MRAWRAGAMAATALAVPAYALAAPGNDDRDHARRISRLPAEVRGTLAGADDDGAQSPCAQTGGAVWYRVDPGVSRRVVARLQAQDDLDATLDVFERVRSRIHFQTCDATDRHGEAAAAFRGVKGHSYLLRVARQRGSDAAGFRLALVGAGAVRLPGPPLPATGVSATLDRAQRTANAWALTLRRGVRYRIAVTHPGSQCIGGGVYAPGQTLSEAPRKTLGCGGYALYAPRHSGVYSVVVRAAGRVRGDQRYELHAGRAQADDSAPGVRLGNYVTARSRLGRLDRVDLYSFDVTRRSVLFLRLRTAAVNADDLLLLTADGRRIGCSCGRRGDVTLHKGLHRGRFFVAVRNRGRTVAPYALMRASQTITGSVLHAAEPMVAPGAAQPLTVQTSPDVDGPVAVTLEQRDPLSGWQYVRTVRAQARDGLAQVPVTVGSDGQWRARARYLGTKGRAPSRTGFVQWTVGGRLRD